MVEAVEQHAPPAPEHPVHGPCKAGTQRVHAPAESLHIVGLDDQMQVIRLDRVVSEAEVLTIQHTRKRPPQLPHQPCIPKRRNVGPDLQGHMAGMPRGQRSPSKVGDPRIGSALAPRSLRLPPQPWRSWRESREGPDTVVKLLISPREISNLTTVPDPSLDSAGDSRAGLVSIHAGTTPRNPRWSTDEPRRRQESACLAPVASPSRLGTCHFEGQVSEMRLVVVSKRRTERDCR